MAAREAVLVSAVRTPIGRAPRGVLRATRPDELAALVITQALARAPGLTADEVGDVILGCAMPEAEQGLNVARIASLRAGLPVTASAMTVNRFCASGLEAIAIAVDRVRRGAADVIIAGGTESMSLIPMGGHHVAPNPWLIAHYPDAYLTTGLVAENHARERGIAREAQDAFALESHRRAVAAQQAGRFAEEIVPVEIAVEEDDARATGAARAGESGGAGRRGERPAFRTVIVDRDEGPRPDTSAEALAALRPAFRDDGTVTAGNASQTSDGAAAVVVTTAERAARAGLTPLARITEYVTVGVEPERFGLGPVPAVRTLLARTGLSLADIDLVELNEAFAAQVLACQQDLAIDPARLNVNGGAIALGHPLGCTGARLATTLVYELRRRNAARGLVTACVGGGMGVAALFER
ncbi:MAG: thiolase family protein [Vicinamibacterales bacterium]